jgi:3-polyprenyl-4-hydroxybenzoate decarboxylase
MLASASTTTTTLLLLPSSLEKICALSQSFLHLFIATAAVVVVVVVCDINYWKTNK